ncbi:MAG TPA: hypothetical protein VG797_06045 [Phycisphaerales bacterium]|nr:hypothetical protein [Phycisphaerales bacterium]
MMSGNQKKTWWTMLAGAATCCLFAATPAQAALTSIDITDPTSWLPGGGLYLPPKNTDTPPKGNPNDGRAHVDIPEVGYIPRPEGDEGELRWQPPPPSNPLSRIFNSGNGYDPHVVFLPTNPVLDAGSDPGSVVSSVPTPGAISVIGLSSLALVRRRRR